MSHRHHLRRVLRVRVHHVSRDDVAWLAVDETHVTADRHRGRHDVRACREREEDTG